GIGRSDESAGHPRGATQPAWRGVLRGDLRGRPAAGPLRLVRRLAGVPIPGARPRQGERAERPAGDALPDRPEVRDPTHGPDDGESRDLAPGRGSRAGARVLDAVRQHRQGREAGSAGGHRDRCVPRLQPAGRVRGGRMSRVSNGVCARGVALLVATCALAPEAVAVTVARDPSVATVKAEATQKAAPMPAPQLPKLTAAQIAERNAQVRGGLAAWRAVQTIQISGLLDAGGRNNARLPYTLQMKRPHYQRVAVELQGQKAVQVYDGQNGSARRIWVDGKTFLESKIEGRPRRFDGKMRRVESYLRDYRKVNGVLFPFVSETWVEGARQTRRMTVDKVVLNPPLEDRLFSKPAAPAGQTAALAVAAQALRGTSAAASSSAHAPASAAPSQ